MDKRYSQGAKVPQTALREIKGGRLNGFSDINPQWRISALTEIYGLCGIGWKFNVMDTQIIPVEKTGETLVYMTVALYVKDGDKWSEPIIGFGGDAICKKERAGYRANDEAFKACLTDALGNAAKCIGIGADVYERLQDTKYDVRPTATVKTPEEVHNDYVNQYTEILENNNIDPIKFIRMDTQNKALIPMKAPDEILLKVINNPSGAVKWWNQQNGNNNSRVAG